MARGGAVATRAGPLGAIRTPDESPAAIGWTTRPLRARSSASSAGGGAGSGSGAASGGGRGGGGAASGAATRAEGRDSVGS
jgi:hypothetical protein